MITYPFSLIVSLLALAVVPLAIGADGAAEPSPTLHPYTKMVESKPVRIGDLEFVAVTEEVWSKSFHLDVQLHIKNCGDKDLLFPTFDTFSVELSSLEGMKLRESGGRDATLVTEPVLIPAHGTYCLCRAAKIDMGRASGIFIYEDGTGSVTNYSPILNGLYSLRFSLGSPPKNKKAATDIPTWSGSGATNEVNFRVGWAR
jgi:hypothetical protein